MTALVRLSPLMHCLMRAQAGKHSTLAQALSLLVYLLVSAFFFFYIQQTVIYDSCARMFAGLFLI